MKHTAMTIAAAALVLAAAMTTPGRANDFRAQGKSVSIRGSSLLVTPPRDWNTLSARPGKFAETWTLDGEQLNDVTFYAGVEPGEPLVRERSKKRDPLPKFTASTLLIDVPELLERTYRAARQIGAFTVTATRPEHFLDHDGVAFAYEYLDSDNLPRRGQAIATLVDGKLYMATFDAPRLHFYERTADDFRKLVASATLSRETPAK